MQSSPSWFAVIVKDLNVQRRCFVVIGLNNTRSNSSMDLSSVMDRISWILLYIFWRMLNADRHFTFSFPKKLSNLYALNQVDQNVRCRLQDGLNYARCMWHVLFYTLLEIVQQNIWGVHRPVYCVSDIALTLKFL